MQPWIRGTVISLAGLIAITAANQCQAEELPPRPEVTLRRCGASPVLDGDLADPCWRQAAILTPFYLYKGHGKTSDVQTVRMAHDDEWLYVAVDVRLPHPEAIQKTVAEHDGNVSADDSVEVFVDPGTGGDMYLHYMLSVANVRAERRCNPKQGTFLPARDITWNVPWRSATRVTKTGWQAELALPLSVFAEQGPLGKMTINVCVNRVMLTLNYMGVPIAGRRENLSWAAVKKSFHEPGRFGTVRGLESLRPKIPLLVSAHSISTGSYRANEQGQFYYDVSGTVHRFTEREGKILLVIEDKPTSGTGETVRQELSLTKEREIPFSLQVPVKALAGRTAKLSLRDVATGESFQSVVLRDMADLSLMRAYARRSYYTTEKEAEIVCEIGLPEQESKKMKLVAKDAAGKQLAEVKDLRPRTPLPVPVDKLALGEQAVSVELQSQDGKVAVSQSVSLVKRTPRPGCEWKIDHADKTILNNGKPFFPFGVMAIFRDGGDPEIAETIAKDIASMGFNMVVRWGRHKFQDFESLSGLLDLGKKHGFCVVDFPASCWNYQPPADQVPKPGMSHDESWDYWMKTVWLPGAKRLMHHPNLMAWYLADEPQSDRKKAARILKLHRALYATDGYHPTEILYIPPVPEGDEFSRNCDILGIDPYWVPGGGIGNLGNPNSVGRQTWLARRRADRDLKLAWITPCAELFSGTRMRVFNEKEQRVQTYLSLINGAGGLLYFVYPFKSQVTYNTFKRLGDEMKVLGPACAAGPVPQKIRYRPVAFDPLNSIFPDVQVSLKRNPSGYILLAANWKPYPVDVTYTLSLLGAVGKVRRLFSDTAPLPVKDSVFSDSMAPMDTRAYTIDGPTDLSGPVDMVVDVVAHREKTNRFYTRVAIPDTGMPGRKNLLRNSGFEECSIPGMPDYYRDLRTKRIQRSFRVGDTRGDCGAGSDTNRPYEGKRCLRLAAFSGANTFVLFGVTPKIDKPTPFVFSAWARGDGGAETEVRFYGPVAKRNRHLLTTEWQRISATGTVTPDIPRGGFLFGFTVSPRSETNTVWLDAMQFELGTELTDYEH